MTEVPEQVRRDLAPTGRLRATINYGNAVLAQRDAATGELGGVSVALAKELARRLGVEAELHGFDAAGKAFAALQAQQCDVGFLAIDPLRAADLAFTAPYVIIEGGYMVRADSPFRGVDEVDREGVRIGAGKNAAYDLFLSRNLKHAKLVYAPTSQAAVQLFLDDGLETVAGIRSALAGIAAQQPGLRVLDGRFMVIEQAMAMPKSRDAGAAYLRAFVEAMKASGFVADALRASGQGDAAVAPPA
jgi:polar amino acid transport system substrate-binding protein